MIKNRIKEFRARFDMKQEDLANLVGVRRETIGNLERVNIIHHWFWHGILQRYFMFQSRKFLLLKNREVRQAKNY